MVSMGAELGMDIILNNIPAVSGLGAAQMLYSESCGRFIITVAPDKRERFEEIFRGMKIGQAGIVTEATHFMIKGERGKPIIEEDVMWLKSCWKKPFAELI
jgi:phosphoribosylformylglycinamidine synthase